jgi:hypothetical protein
MSDFMPEPSWLLPDKDTTILAIREPQWMTWDFPRGWLVKSAWLCDELNHYEATIGYPYNARVQHWIEKKEGWEPFEENGSPLSRLIYNAQRFRKSDRLRTDGWVPGSQAVLADAHAIASRIQVLCDSVIGGSSITECWVKLIGDRYYAMPPNHRTRGLEVSGQPIRLLPLSR